MTTASDIKLQTTQLILKCPQIENAGAFARLANNANIVKNRCCLPHPLTMDWVQKYLSQSISEFGDRSFKFGIYLKNDISTPYIGEISLSALYNCEPALAYWLGENYWGKGYGTEAVTAVVKFAFSTLGTPFIEADYFLDNPASGRILEKCGFEPAGRKLFWSAPRMKFVSGQSMLMTRENWAKHTEQSHEPF